MEEGGMDDERGSDTGMPAGWGEPGATARCQESDQNRGRTQSRRHHGDASRREEGRNARINLKPHDEAAVRMHSLLEIPPWRLPG